ncbi:MAG: hypothetical protein JWL77_4931 [Chthonomonadaceae bacterium]|nr:hypothetical protein [Chthonomonadaceae bacterium]
MSRRNQKTHHKPANPAPRPTGPQSLGLKAFHVGNYGEAIRLWSGLDSGAEPPVRAAIAEAHFRRALATRVSVSEAVADLRAAVDLLPEEARFWYQLGLILHRSDRLEEARRAYARAADLGLVRRGIGVVRGLAELEVDPQLSLDSLPWLTPEARTALVPVARLLQGETGAAPTLRISDNNSLPPNAADPVTAFWYGLTLLANGFPQDAYAALAPAKGQRLPIGVEPIRAFYFGVAAALAGKPQVALSHWRDMTRLGQASARPPHLTAYITQIIAHSILAHQQDGQWEEALKEAQSGAKLAPDDPWLLQAILVATNRLAAAAREAGDWDGAVDHWQIMRSILEKRPDLGPLSPILHNLAIAHEATEEWEEAAKAWAALLNTLPGRRGGRASKNPAPATAGPSHDEQRAWMRRRILDNYKRADLPEEAIAYYKQAIKADPENLQLRLEMASALLANEQIIAGRNEVQRILDKDPNYVDALLLLAEIHQARDEGYAAEQALIRVLEIDPKHDTARKALRQTIVERGMDAFNSGRYPQARDIYTRALTYIPNDPQVLAFLGETELVLGRKKEAHAHFDAVLAVGTPEAYLHMFSVWARSLNESEARKVIQRAEGAGFDLSDFYIAAGIVCLNRVGPIDVPVPAGARQPSQAWVKWGPELIEKGLDSAPDRADALARLLPALGPKHAEITVGYARQRVELKPEDPEPCIDLAFYQGFAGDAVGAKKTLTQADQLARKQGRKDLIDKIAEFRRELDSPFFGMLGSFMRESGLDLEDLEDLDEDFFR